METSQSRKSFEGIHEDYSFFLGHSTEPAACRSAMLGPIKEKFGARGALKMLDFGCGGGEFLERLLESWNYPKNDLELALIEVDPGYLEAARKKTAIFSTRPIRASVTAQESENSLDLITSNHVLYYVKDLPATLGLFKKWLKPGGLGIVILGGRGNQLCRLWELAFGRAGQAVPYYLAEDVLAVLEDMKANVVHQTVQSQLRFPDTLENRRKILRFLFQGKPEGPGPETLSGLMDGWSVGGEIVMENADSLYLLQN